MDPLLVNLIALMLTVSLLFLSTLAIQITKSLHQRYHQNSAEALYSMFLFISPSKILMASIASALLIGLITYWLSQSWTIIIPLLVVSLFAPGVVIRQFLRNRSTQIVSQLPDTIEAIALSMQAGMNFNNAFELVVKEEKPPLSQEFALVLKEVKLGTSFDQALYNLEHRLPIESIKYMVSGILISREVGGNLADMLMTLSKTMRRINEVEQKVSALTAQGRFQGKVMTGLPLILCLGLYALEPEAMSMLWVSPIGWAVIAVTLVMLSMGYFAIQKIVNIKV